MNEGRRLTLSMTLPDWGQDHLSPEVVAAFVDGELADGPFGRATRHLDDCAECDLQVAAQRQARSALRSAPGPSLPSSLMSSLFSIPQDTELPGAPAGLAVTADGQLVALLHPESAEPTAPRGTAHGTTSLRMRLGAGVAMSGLALGAIALGAAAVVSDAPAADRGVFDGSVLGGPPVVQAQLRVTPTDPDIVSAGLLRRGPSSFLSRH